MSPFKPFQQSQKQIEFNAHLFWLHNVDKKIFYKILWGEIEENGNCLGFHRLSGLSSTWDTLKQKIKDYILQPFMCKLRLFCKMENNKTPNSQSLTVAWISSETIINSSPLYALLFYK